MLGPRRIAAMGLVIPVALSLAMARDCLDDCKCLIQWGSSTTPVSQTPPDCLLAGSCSFTFAQTPPAQSGCCHAELENCLLGQCSYKVIVTVSAKEGQTCNFKITPPGPDSSRTCNNASTCSYTSISTYAMHCGVGHDYIIKANGAVVCAKTVYCLQCEHNQTD